MLMENIDQYQANQNMYNHLQKNNNLIENNELTHIFYSSILIACNSRMKLSLQSYRRIWPKQIRLSNSFESKIQIVPNRRIVFFIGIQKHFH